MAHFSPHFPLKFFVVYGRANFVSCFVIAKYLYKNAMLTWRQSWSDLSSFTSSNQWRETAMKKENEKHWDFIANTSRRQINSSRRRMPVSFYRFLRYVSVNTISSVSLWILIRTKTLFARRFDTFTSASFCMITEISYTYTSIFLFIKITEVDKKNKSVLFSVKVCRTTRDIMASFHTPNQSQREYMQFLNYILYFTSTASFRNCKTLFTAKARETARTFLLRFH